MKQRVFPMIFAVVMTTTLSARRLFSQEEPSVRLTLREAVQLALKQNPQVQIANLKLGESQLDRSIARSALLPQANFEAASRAERMNLGSSFGANLPGIPHHAGPFEVFQSGPSFSMPVFDLTLWRRWQASHQSVKASRADQQTVREQIVALVVSQYLAALRATAQVRAAQSRVDLATALYNQAVQLEKNGVGTNLDTVRANVQLLNEKQGLLVAQTQLKTALYGLAQLLHLETHRTVQLDDEMSFFETPEITLEGSIEQACANRPEMMALVSRESAARLEKRAASESRLPKLSLGGNWSYQGNSIASAIPVYTYQASVDFPLFTGGRIRAEIAKADLELRKTNQEKAQLQDQIALETKTAVAQLESARSQVDVANQGVELARREVTQAGDRFREGVTNNIEVTAAQDALARANDNQIEALYRYNQARADLARAIGQMQNLYAK